MIEFRSVMPKSVTKPTTEPSESQPPVASTATTPPISANGRLMLVSKVWRSEPKASNSRLTTPNVASADAISRSLRACGVVAGCEPPALVTALGVMGKPRPQLGHERLGIVPALQVRDHRLHPLAAFAQHLVAAFDQRDIGDVPQLDQPPGWCAQRESLHLAHVLAR